MTKKLATIPEIGYSYRDENSVKKEGCIKLSFEFDDGTGRRYWVSDMKDAESTIQLFDFSLSILREHFVAFYKNRLES